MSAVSGCSLHPAHSSCVYFDLQCISLQIRLCDLNLLVVLLCWFAGERIPPPLSHTHAQHAVLLFGTTIFVLSSFPTWLTLIIMYHPCYFALPVVRWSCWLSTHPDWVARDLWHNILSVSCVCTDCASSKWLAWLLCVCDLMRWSSPVALCSLFHSLTPPCVVDTTCCWTPPECMDEYSVLSTVFFWLKCVQSTKIIKNWKLPLNICFDSKSRWLFLLDLWAWKFILDDGNSTLKR